MPSPRPYARPRHRLIESLSGALGRARVILFCAPAGFGKTTLLSQLLAQRPETAVWYSFDAFDTGEILCTHLNTALGRDARSDFQDLLAWLSVQSQPMILVFDDYHLAKDERIHEFSASLVRRLPPNISLLVTSRKDPDFSLAALRASGELHEMRPEELAFDLAEIRELMEALGVELDEAQIRQVQELSEGWPAAVLILAQAWQRGRGILAPPESCPQDVLVDYLLKEVLLSYTPCERSVLATMSLLDRFTPELCAALCPGPPPWEWSDSWFMIALDRHWYRLHHVFSRHLRDNVHLFLSSTQRQQIHLQAAAWFEQHHLQDEAIAHALMGQGWGQAGRLLKQRKSLAELLNFCLGPGSGFPPSRRPRWIRLFRRAWVWCFGAQCG